MILYQIRDYLLHRCQLEHLLEMVKEKSKDRKARREKYKDLIKGKFRLDCVVRIERVNDMDARTDKEADFFSKSIDFTHETIKKLIDVNIVTRTKMHNLFDSIHNSKELFHIGIRS